MSPNPEHADLFARACDGRASAEELAALHRLLRDDPAARDAWLHYAELHGELAAGGALAAAPAPRRSAPGALRRWLPWSTPAAAGLVVGLCAATMVWAYVRPPVPRMETLVEEDFEDHAVPLAIRTPLEAGVWRSDVAEIVGAEDGVQPAEGQRMLRLLRADHDGRAKPTGGHIAAAYRLIDLRPYRQEIAAGAGVVEISASFNAAVFPEGERYGCAISVYALDEDALPDRPGRLGSTLTNEALAMARSSRTPLDRDPATWQRVTTELRLPADAEYLAVRLHISQAFEAEDRPVFTGSFVDNVRVSLTRRAPLP
jgi:hypothetical protein